jgi:APA family basic amino acid/polyamine antiporter
MLLSTGAGLLLAATGTFEQILGISAFLYVAIYTTGFVSLIVLRRREPDLPRPFRAWGYPWTTSAVLAGSLLFLAGAVVTDTTNSLYAALLIALSYPVYRLAKRVREGR